MVTLPDGTLGEFEHRLIQQASQRTNGKVSQAAGLLGIRRGTLRRRLEPVNGS